MSKDAKISSQFSAASSNRSKGGIHKRVVSVAIQDVQKLSLRGDHHISSPPSDSWAWRKYGQKPIKGSPYPRGYYKCSSSKGCPARKQVERSKVDPHMLLVTYSSEHNHPCPVNNHDTSAISEDESSEVEEEGELGEMIKRPNKKKLKCDDEDELVVPEERSKLIANDIHDNMIGGEEPLMPDYAAGEFGLFSDLDSPAILDRCPVMADRDRISTDEEMAMIFTTMVEEEEEWIFSDLGELPECAAVFR